LSGHSLRARRAQHEGRPIPAVSNTSPYIRNQMTRFKRVALCIAAAQLSVAAAHSQAPQAVNTRLQVTTTSADARTAFWAAWSDQTNVFISRARMQAVKAVALDPAFGLARTFSASISTPASGMTLAQREQELNRGV